MYCGHKLKDGGLIGVVCGPMKSGKSNEIISLVHKLQFQNQVDFHVFKSITDTREGTEKISCRDETIPCTPIEDPEDFLSYKNHLYLIDEAQFFPDSIVPVVEELAWRQKHVILFGLDLNFKREPFGHMNDLMCFANYVNKLTAYCDVCGDIARYTQRLLDGNPVPYDGPLIIVGDREYEARCQRHHSLPGKD